MRRLTGYGPAFLVLLTAGLVLLLVPRVMREINFQQASSRMMRASDSLEQSSILNEFNQAFRDIAALVEPSVVHISVERSPGTDPRTGLSSGSGWIYDDRGHIVTNHHVVSEGSRIQVQLVDGEIRTALLVGSDETTDIAVLKISPVRLHPAIRADPENEVRQGDLVFAFGSPFDFRFSMSSGVISGRDRSVGVLADSMNRIGYENFLQVDAVINPGNSGGPLTNYRGAVIGMNTAIATHGGSVMRAGQFAGVGLAIPLDMIEPVVQQLIDKGFVAKGYLGIVIDDFDPALREEYGFFQGGVRISRVQPGGPAATSGLRDDDIIFAVNGRPVAARRQLQSVISSLLPGSQVHLDVWRRRTGTETRGEELSVSIALGRLDTLELRGEIPGDQSEYHIILLGIASMQTVDRETAVAEGLPVQRGVLLKSLVAGSRLAGALPPGSIIVAVHDVPVASTREFIEELSRHVFLPRTAAGGGGVVADCVLPDGGRKKVRLVLPSQ